MFLGQDDRKPVLVRTELTERKTTLKSRMHDMVHDLPLHCPDPCEFLSKPQQPKNNIVSFCLWLFLLHVFFIVQIMISNVYHCHLVDTAQFFVFPSLCESLCSRLNHVPARLDACRHGHTVYQHVH